MDYKIVIPAIAVVAVLVASGITIDVFADHTYPENVDARMIAFKIHGNGGGFTSDASFTKFLKDNNGAEHHSSWNSFNRDPSHENFPANCGLLTSDDRCHWLNLLNSYASYFDSHGQQKRFIVEGYSFGGGGATFVTTDTRNSDVQFDMVWLLDPVGSFSERTGVSSICPYSPVIALEPFIGLPLLLAMCTDDRVFFSNTKHVVAAYQRGGPPPIFTWGTHLNFQNPNSVPTDYFELANPPLGAGVAHSKVATDALGQGRVIQVLEGLANNGPQFSVFPNQITFDEGSSITETIQATDILTAWDKNPNLFFRVPFISNELVLTGLDSGSLTGSLTRTGSVTIFADDNSTSKIMLQVEDNGFPCNNCREGTRNENGTHLSDCDSPNLNYPGGRAQCRFDRMADDFFEPGSTILESNFALGWWQNKTATVIVNNVPPTDIFGFSTFQGSDANLLLKTTDPSEADTTAGFTYEIDWGDGSPLQIEDGYDNSVTSFSHSYLSGIYTVKVSATDKDGGKSDEFAFTVATPFYTLLDDIEDLKNDGTLNKGQANSFTSKVEAIIQSIDKGNFTPACNVADALINEINAFVKSKKLTQKQAAELLVTIDEEKDPIGCNGGVISVIKQTNPDDHPEPFTFTGDVSGIIRDNEQIKTKNLAPGIYSAIEDVPFTWVLDEVLCSDENSFRPIVTTSAEFRVEENEYVVCIFFNEIGHPFVPLQFDITQLPFHANQVEPSPQTSTDTESDLLPNIDYDEFSEYLALDSYLTIDNRTVSIAEIFPDTIANDGSSHIQTSDFAVATFNTVSSNPSSAQPSDDVTDDKGSGGDEHLTRPTFGLSHETFETIVDSGFRFNDQSFTINDNHHTPFAQQTVNIGEVNTFEAKIYADKRLKVQEFLFGIPNVGEAHLAELGVEVWYDLNGEIEEVKAVQKSNVIDKETLVATHEKTKCQELDIDERCDVTKVEMVFLEPLNDKVMAVKAIDYKNRYQITYLNEGVDIAGESLNPMQTNLIPSNVRDGGLIKVTQLEKYSRFWQSEDGRMFEMNSFGSFKEVNQKFERFQDDGTAYTRLHSGFGGVMAYEQKRATLVFDGNDLLKVLPDYEPFTGLDIPPRMNEEIKQKMLAQEKIAKEILETEYRVDRYY